MMIVIAPQPHTHRVRTRLPWPPQLLQKDRVSVIREFWFVLVFFTFPYPKGKNILILLSFMDLFLAVVLMHSNNPLSTGLHVGPVHTKPTGLHDSQSRTAGSGHRCLVLGLTSWGHLHLWKSEPVSHLFSAPFGNSAPISFGPWSS